MTPEAAAAASRWPVIRLGGAFMTDRETHARGAELGLDGWAFYYAGRGGVLGDVDASVVQAAFVFLPPAMVRRGWDKARGLLAYAEAAGRYAAACQHWGRTHLTGFDGVKRLGELCVAVARAADPAGMTLFGGWRAVPLPDDAPARTAQLLQVLREHRGGTHGIAVLAAGLTPLQAIVAGPLGPSQASFQGWPEPYPDPAPFRKRHAEAERVTDRLLAAAYAALTVEERAELVALLQAAQRHATGQQRADG